MTLDDDGEEEAERQIKSSKLESGVPDVVLVAG